MEVKLIKEETIEEAYKKAKKIMDLNALRFIDCFPYLCTDVNGRYAKSRREDMCNGFWTGIYILAYETSGDTRYRHIVSKYVEKMYNRLFEGDITGAEMGILYVPSCVAATRIGKIKIAKTAGVVAADILVSIYKKIDDCYFVNDNYLAPSKDNYVPMKISAMLNCSILYWASEVTGVEDYKMLANDVINFIADNLIDESGTVWWEYDFKKYPTGESFIHGDNCRGIAWALYGLAVRYRQDREKHIFDKILRILEKYAPQIQKADFCSMDSTMLACIVCALYEISGYADESFEKYHEFADWMLLNIIERFSLEPFGKTDGLIGNADGMSYFDAPMKNVSAVAGDYFYMEALVRKMKSFRLYI